jgi:hypothetical protein
MFNLFLFSLSGKNTQTSEVVSLPYAPETVSYLDDHHQLQTKTAGLYTTMEWHGNLQTGKMTS